MLSIRQICGDWNEAKLKRDRLGEVPGDEDAYLPKWGGSDVVNRLMGKTN